MLATLRKKLLDLFPTTARLCGLEVPQRLQGQDLSAVFDDPSYSVREAAFSVSGANAGFLLREERWAYIQYGEDAAKGIELYDMQADPHQYVNLADREGYLPIVDQFKAKMKKKLTSLRTNDL
jgi:iduronate 2-sulfatase